MNWRSSTERGRCLRDSARKEPPTRIVEGVTYYRFAVRFRTTDGKVHRLTHWSPGAPWVRGEVTRRLVETYGVEGIKPQSCTIKGPR